MLQIGYVLAVCVLVLLKVSCVTNTSIEASDTHTERYTGQFAARLSVHAHHSHPYSLFDVDTFFVF